MLQTRPDNVGTAIRLDVIVIGSGPVGMTAAAELARYGLTVRIVDKRETTVAHSHALTVHVRTQEVLQAMGIEQQWRDHGTGFDEISVHAFGRHLATVPLSGVDGDPFSGPINIGQNVTETLLVAHLASLGVTVERPVEAVAFTEDADRVRIKLQHPDGRQDTVEACYVIGCEGSNSLVRKTANIAFEGEQHAGIEFLQTDCRVRCAYPRGRGHLFINADRFIGMFPLDQHGRYRVLCARSDENPQDRSAPTLEAMQAIFRAAVDPGAVLSDPEWLNRFRTQHRVATRFRAGPRAFIAGDAGHVHVPVAGQGMNTGMQDAFNLAWKLAYVQHGWASADLLDSYDAERQPNALQLVGFTNTAFRNAVQPSPLIRRAIRLLGGPILRRPFVQSRFRAKIAEIGIHYRESGLSRQIGRTSGPRAGDRLPDAPVVAAFERIATRLHDVLIGRHWTLLVFAGHGPVSAASLPELAAAAGGHGQVRAFLVARDPGVAASANWTGDVLLDADGDAHEAVAARVACVIVVRPDWHIGWRGPIGHAAEAIRYLHRILRGSLGRTEAERGALRESDTLAAR